MLELQTILHPTALQPGNRAAFRAAHAWAHRFGARVVILHVMRPWQHHGRGVMLGDYTLEKINRAQTLTRDWTEDSDVLVEHRLGEGNPAEVILSHARVVKPDLTS